MATIKSVEVRVQSSIKSVEVGGGIPGSPGTDGTDGADGADGVSITGASINGSGHLILTLSSGGPIDVGLVVGADGTDGTDGADGADGVSITGATVNGSGHLILSLSTGGTVDAGLVVGADGTDGTDGTDGADGVSITGATVDGSYNLILSLSTGGTINAGYVRGPAGAGSGDVIGPASAVAGNFATFGDTSGDLLADSGVSATSFATAAQGTLADSAVQPAAVGVSVQAYDADLSAIGALPKTDGNFIVGDGTTWVAESGATARTSLGLGSVATLNTGTGSGNVPVLDGSGKLVTSILPAMALTDTNVVASQAAMLALTAQQGDLAIRTDINKSFVLSSNSPSTLADWKELLSPTDAVLSVAGLTGAISASGLRSALNLVIGTDVQAYNALITAIAALGSNGLVARTAAGTAAARTITGTANQLTVTNGDGVSGNPTLSLPADVLIPTALTVPNTGLHLLDTNGSHDVILKPGSDVTADRTITIVTGDSDRTLDLTISSGGGAYEFVGNFTASAATSLVITSGFHADYDEYVFNIRNMVTSTSTFLTLQVYEDGGTTPIGGTAYSSGGSVATNGTSYWRFHNIVQAATSLSIGEVKLLRCSTTLTGMLSQTVQRNAGGTALPATQHGHVVTTAKINAVRWSVWDSNITIDVDMYRIKSV